jgi:subtilisin family serine protease
MSSTRMRFWQLAIALVVLLGLTSLPQQSQAAPAESKLSDPRVDSTTVSRYLVQLEGEPVALFANRLRPTGKTDAKLDYSNPSVQAYKNQVISKRNSTLNAIQTKLGRTVKPIEVYETAFNGFAIDATAAEMRAIAKLPNVLSYQEEQIYTLTTDVGPKWIGADQIQDGSATGIYAATLLGSNLTPAVSSTNTGRGTFSFDSSDNSLAYTINVAEDTTSAEIINITDSSTVASLTSQSARTYAGSITLTANQVTALEDDELFVVVKSAANPTGELGSVISGYKGEGVIVGIIDSGINMQHPSFAEVGGDGYEHINPFGQGNFIGACDPSNQYHDASIVCNNKLIGAWTFAATSVISNFDTGAKSPNDEDGHGSHTASTVAGNIINNPEVNGVDFTRVSGVAPHANIIAYDVCGFLSNGSYSGNCTGSALMGAIDQALEDGVDVINYSISGGTSPWTDYMEYSFLIARSIGTVVSTSAGNEGPSVGTVNHLSPWVLSVAATTHNRALNNSITNITDGTDIYPTILGAGTTTALPTDTEIILASTLGGTNPQLCGAFDPTQAAQIAGKIVFCERGTYGRVEKAQNVADAGGVGYILMNDAGNGSSLVADAFPIPGVHISYNNGIALRSWLQSHPGATARISGTTFDFSNSNADIMASFSSRGPAPAVFGNVIKPDLGAPGVDIVAAVADTGSGSPDFDLLSGTSMASPHTAGSAALLRGLHPDWSAGEIQSALMTTSTAPILKENGTTPTTPFDIGTGRIQVALAAHAGLVMDEDPQTFWDANEDAVAIAALNVPSMATTSCVVTCSWERTFRNTLDTAVEWTFSGETANLTASPSTFTIPAGGTQTVEFTLDVNGKPLGSYVFDRATLTASGNVAPAVALPVAAIPAASSIPSTQIISNNTAAYTHELEATFVPYSDFTTSVIGLTKGTTRTRTIEDGDYAAISLNVPVNTARFVVDLRESPSNDLDLEIYRGGTLVCQSATAAVLEYCSIDNPTNGAYTIYIDNYEASSPGATDPVVFVTAIVPNSDAGNFTVTAPATNASAGQLTVNQNFNLAGSAPGDSWYGVYSVTDTVNSVNLGKSKIDFHHVVGAPANISVESGNNQTTEVGTAFANPIGVKVTDNANNPIPGVQVTFDAPGAGASATLSAATATTNANGIATVNATANTIVGNYVVTASAGALSTNITLTNTAGSLAGLVLNAGDAQSARVGNPFINALEVQAIDQYGNAISGIDIEFAAPSTGASATLSSATATTNANGQASVTATANTVAGSYKVTASNGAHSVEFNLTNTVSAIASLEIVSGDAQSAEVNKAFGSALVVKASDSYGNLVPNAAITFSAPSSGASASLSNTTVTTGANGQASVDATANGTAGTYKVTASHDSVSVEFNLTNTPAQTAPEEPEDPTYSIFLPFVAR